MQSNQDPQLTASVIMHVQHVRTGRCRPMQAHAPKTPRSPSLVHHLDPATLHDEQPWEACDGRVSCHRDHPGWLEPAGVASRAHIAQGEAYAIM